MIVGEDVEEVFNLLIELLSLAICLGVVCNTGIAHDPEQEVELLHESGHEVGTAITNDLNEEPVVTEDMVLESPGYS